MSFLFQNIFIFRPLKLFYFEHTINKSSHLANLSPINFRSQPSILAETSELFPIPLKNRFLSFLLVCIHQTISCILPCCLAVLLSNQLNKNLSLIYKINHKKGPLIMIKFPIFFSMAPDIQSSF